MIVQSKHPSLARDTEYSSHTNMNAAATTTPGASLSESSGPDATDPIPGALSSDSSGPDSCADGSSVSFGPQKMRYGESILDGPCYFPRNYFLDYYGSVDGAARWDRAKVYDSDKDAGGSDDGAIVNGSVRDRVHPDLICRGLQAARLSSLDLLWSWKLEVVATPSSLRSLSQNLSKLLKRHLIVILGLK